MQHQLSEVQFCKLKLSSLLFMGYPFKTKAKLLLHICSTLGHVYNSMTVTGKTTPHRAARAVTPACPGHMFQPHAAHRTLFNRKSTGQVYDCTQHTKRLVNTQNSQLRICCFHKRLFTWLRQSEYSNCHLCPASMDLNQFSVCHEASTEDQTACKAGLPFVKTSGHHENKQPITGKVLPCTVSFSLSLMTSFSLLWVFCGFLVFFVCLVVVVVFLNQLSTLEVISKNQLKRRNFLKGSLFSSPRHVSLRAKSTIATQKAVTTYIKFTEQHRLQIAVNIHAQCRRTVRLVTYMRCAGANRRPINPLQPSYICCETESMFNF